MDKGTKQLAIIATLLFFPTAVVGWAIYNSNPARALLFFQLSIYCFLFASCLAAFIIYTQGGKLIPVIGSFY